VAFHDLAADRKSDAGAFVFGSSVQALEHAEDSFRNSP
jgi:hypothetical protein